MSSPLLSDLGSLRDPAQVAVDEALALVGRIQDRDHTVWGDDPTEIADRLGWLDAPARAAAEAPDLQELVAGVIADGITDVLLVGMGGSSLYPEVLARSFGPATGAPRLWVLDSTDPAAVLAIEEELPWQATLLVPASKSGTTIEMACHLARFYERLRDAQGADAPRYVVPITDPGSQLDARAADEGFRGVVHGHPDVGGRYSALTPFGLLPAALLGIDPVTHVAAAEPEFAAAASTDPSVNAPFVLGAVLAAAARAGRDKLTLLLPEQIASFGLWVEQLVAESTGKHGTGILPVVDEQARHALVGEDRLVVALGDHPGLDDLVDAGVPLVRLPFSSRAQLSGEVARWEIATAVAGALLDVNPFDQPDVSAAKQATARVLDSGDELPPTDDPERVLSTVEAGDYVALLGFVTPGSDDERTLRRAADDLRDRLEVPVTVGIGPRYLHSTGQLHKGGPDTGVFLQVVADDEHDLPIPGERFGFATLKRAQAAGDLQALGDAGRRVVHVALDDLAAANGDG